MVSARPLPRTIRAQRVSQEEHPHCELGLRVAIEEAVQATCHALADHASFLSSCTNRVRCADRTPNMLECLHHTFNSQCISAMDVIELSHPCPPCTAGVTSTRDNLAPLGSWAVTVHQMAMALREVGVVDSSLRKNLRGATQTCGRPRDRKSKVTPHSG